MSAQTLIDSTSFAQEQVYKSLWGMDFIEGKLYCGSDWSGEIFEIDESANVVNSMNTPLDLNHGLAFYNDQFIVAEDFSSNGALLYFTDLDGNLLEEMPTPSILGDENMGGIGGLHVQGDALWISVYYPDFDEFPFAHIYKMDLLTGEVIDSVSTWGAQPQGIAIKGDTMFYVLDRNDSDDDEERIYAHSLTTNDTLFSWLLPDPDGDQSPRGLAWNGEHLFCLVDRAGGSAFSYKQLYKYEIDQSTPATPASISLESDTLDFGEVDFAFSDTLSISATNNGDEDLLISDFYVPYDVVFLTNDLPIVITPGESIDLTFAFWPVDNFAIEMPGTLTTNDPENSTIEIIFQGIGTVPEVPVISYSLEEGQETLGLGFFTQISIRNAAAIITNNGTGDLIIDTIYYEEYYEFIYLDENLTFPLVLAPGESWELISFCDGDAFVDFLPFFEFGQELYAIAMNLFIESNDPNQMILEIPVNWGVNATGLEVEMGNIEFYPNPAINRIQFQSEQEIKSYSIVNLEGKSISQQSNESVFEVEIDVSDLPNGIYFLRINELKNSFPFLIAR